MLTVLLIFVPMPLAIYANDTIRVSIDDQFVSFEGQNPVIVDGRTLVPVRGVFEALGFDVGWNPDSQQVTLTSDDVVVLTIGSNAFLANGTSHILDVPAQIINGRTMLPIRAVVESVGYYVGWSNAARTVLISSVPITNEPLYNHQILEEFLVQFESLFLTSRRRQVSIDGEVLWDYVFKTGIDGAQETIWDYTQQNGTSNLIYIIEETTIYRNPGGSYGSRRVFFNQHGIPIVPEDVSFIIHNNYDSMYIARNFELFDLSNDDVPEITITFWETSWWFSKLYRFIDGQFREVQTYPHLPIGRYHFFHDEVGNLGIIASSEGGTTSNFYNITGFSNDVMNLAFSFTPDWSLEWTEQGLIPIQPLTNLQESIIVSVTQRLGITG